MNNLQNALKAYLATVQQHGGSLAEARKAGIEAASQLMRFPAHVINALTATVEVAA